MKIAFITPLMIIGGAETYILQKSLWLIKHGYQVVIISGECKIVIPQSLKFFLVRGIELPPYMLCNKKRSSLIKQLNKILQEEDVDVIEAHNSFPIIYVALGYSKAKIPYLLNVLNEGVYNKNIQLRYLTKILNNYKLYYTLTSQMNKYIEHKCKSSLSPYIIPIPVQPCLSENNLEGNYLLSVCRMSPEKMYVMYLIEGFANLKKKNIIDSSIKLLVIGDGDFFEEVKALADSVNNESGMQCVEMRGTITGKELENLYKNCIAYIGMGTSMLLAAAYFKPVVIVGSLPKDQMYAWGFWGLNPEIDEHSIVANEDYSNNRTSYEKTLELIVNNKDFREHCSVASGNLFKKVYDENRIMIKWDSQYKSVARYKYNAKLALLSHYLQFVNWIAFYMYGCYKILKKHIYE